MGLLINLVKLNDLFHSSDLKKNSQILQTEIEKYNQTISDEDFQKIASICKGGWSIDLELGLLLNYFVNVENKNRIIEFGSGSSTLLFDIISRNKDDRFIYSVEQNPDWSREVVAKVNNLKNDFHFIIDTPKLRLSWFGLSYNFLKVKKEVGKKRFNLVLIDAPQYFFSRVGTILSVIDNLETSGYIILDDAQRGDEKWSIWKWIKMFKGLEPVLYFENYPQKGVCVIQKKREVKPVFNLLIFVLGVFHGMRKMISRPYRIEKSMLENGATV